MIFCDFSCHQSVLHDWSCLDAVYGSENQILLNLLVFLIETGVKLCQLLFHLGFSWALLVVVLVIVMACRYSLLYQLERDGSAEFYCGLKDLLLLMCLQVMLLFVMAVAELEVEYFLFHQGQLWSLSMVPMSALLEYHYPTFH